MFEVIRVLDSEMLQENLHMIIHTYRSYIIHTQMDFGYVSVFLHQMFVLRGFISFLICNAIDL